MRVMVLVKATTESEAGVMPSAELMTAMGRFNEEIAKAVNRAGFAGGCFV
jgi:hypothetical protein